MVESSVSFPFGIKTKRSFAVLDKSFLDGVSSAQLQYYAQTGWIFGLTEVLMHEHFRKRDARRIANLFKLRSIEKNLVLLPGIGEMFRAEKRNLKPAPKVLPAKAIKFIVERGPSGEFFELDGNALRSTKERAAEVKWRLRKMIAIWRLYRIIPQLGNAKPSEMPAGIEDLSLRIRDDREDMRGVYRNYRDGSSPAPELLDEDWATFRWIQVQLLAGLDFYAGYGLDKQPNREKLVHELLDLDYLVTALLVGGLACRETRFIERFRFLRPDGVVLM
jgi:hypothetical protein